MELILKEDVENLGFKDDLVKVKNGYGRNFLIPNGLAMLATESNKKVLAEKEPFLQILFINNLIAMLIGILPMLIVFKVPNIIQAIELIMIAGAMVLGQFFFLNALKGTETTYIAPFFYMTLVFVMFLDLVFFGTFPDLVSIIGAALIIFGGIFISLRINLKVFD